MSYLRIGLLIAVLLNVACGETAGDSTTTSQVVTTTSSSTSTTTTTPTPPIPVLSDLTGTWVNERAVLQVNDAGDYIVLGPDSDPEQPLTLGFVARDDVNVIFVSGVNGECPGQTGVYNAGVDADTLTLTLVDDPCAARTQWFELPFILEQ